MSYHRHPPECIHGQSENQRCHDCEGMARDEIDELANDMRLLKLEHERKNAALRAKVERLKGERDELRLSLDVAEASIESKNEALEALGVNAGDDYLWAQMKHERDAARAELADYKSRERARTDAWEALAKAAGEEPTIMADAMIRRVGLLAERAAELAALRETAYVDGVLDREQTKALRAWKKERHPHD